MPTVFWIVVVLLLMLIVGWFAKSFGWDIFIEMKVDRAVLDLRHKNYVVMQNFTYAMHAIREVEGIVYEKPVIGVQADYGDMTFERTDDNVATLTGKTVGVEYVLTLVGKGNIHQIGTKQGLLKLTAPGERRGLFSGAQALTLELDLNSTFTPTDRGMLTNFFTEKKRTTTPA